MSRFSGLECADLPACYRDRAQQIADGEVVRPVCALTVEFAANGDASRSLFGYAGKLAERERVALLLESMNVLSNAAINCNAEAAN